MESGSPGAAADAPAAEAAEGLAAVVPVDVEQSQPMPQQAGAPDPPPETTGRDVSPAIEIADAAGAAVVEWGVLATPGGPGAEAPQSVDEAFEADVAPDGSAEVRPEAPIPIGEQPAVSLDASPHDDAAADHIAEPSQDPDIQYVEPERAQSSLITQEPIALPRPADVTRPLQGDEPVAAPAETGSEPEFRSSLAQGVAVSEAPSVKVPEVANDAARHASPFAAKPDVPRELVQPGLHSEVPSEVPAEPWTQIARRVARRGLRYAAYGLAGYLALTVVLVFVYRFINPPMSTLMIYESLLGAGAEQDWVPIEEISPHLIRAVVVAEDGRFCDHNGIDLAAMRYAILRARDGVPAGASTISMQVTKNLFLWPSRSFIRKLIEIPLTLLMELIWPKSRILEVYLNIAEWAPGVFGAEAAARHHFGKPASALGEREAARLAAALPNPIVRDAGQPGPRLVRRAGMIQNRIRLSGDVTFCVRQGR